jgi:hypothetical protein
MGVFAAHPTLMGADSLLYCGDYPGHWQLSVEEVTGGFALFFAGGMGSPVRQSNPRITRQSMQ